jgi:hypothetical protein
MKKPKFSEEQIAYALRVGESGRPAISWGSRRPGSMRQCSPLTRSRTFRHRLDPVLPLSPGRAERHGFEYYRHGTPQPRLQELIVNASGTQKCAFS